MRYLIFLLLTLGAVPDVQPQAKSRAGGAQAASGYEAALTSILQKAVTDDGEVRYDMLRGPLNDEFRNVLRAVEDYDVSRLKTDAEKLAFWMNAYNVQMLQNVIGAPEIENIIEEGYADRFFKTAYVTAGRSMTLDEIEHVILRRQEGRPELEALRVSRLDPRIHVGLNCAAYSCPVLRNQAFTAARIDADLDDAMRAFTTAKRHFRVESGSVVLSSLLQWYGPDFDSTGRPAGDYLLSYMPATRPHYERLRQLLQGRTAAQIAEAPGVRFQYLWDVNGAG